MKEAVYKNLAIGLNEVVLAEGTEIISVDGSESSSVCLLIEEDSMPPEDTVFEVREFFVSISSSMPEGNYNFVGSVLDSFNQKTKYYVYELVRGKS
jgi:hypothetical protein